MNRTFKVVFNKARGALMVANEATCSVQKKGAKTVVAVAAALAMGSSMAADWVIPETDVVLTNDSVSEEQYQENSTFAYTRNDTAAPGGFYSTDKTGSFTGEVWVTAKGAKAEDGKYVQSHALAVTGSGIADAVTLTNEGTIHIQAIDSAYSWAQKGMIAMNGAVAVNDGIIEAKNAYGMTVGTADSGAVASKLINRKTINVTEQGVGIELGGVSGSSAENRGTITVSDIVDHGGENNYWGHGVLIKDSSGNTFTNYGTINASGEGATAIEIQVSSNNTTSGNVINLEKGSSISGLIHNHASVEGTVLNANGFVGEIDLKNDSADGMTINVNQGAELTLADGHGSQALTAVVNDGKLSASIWQKYTVGEGEEAKEASDNVFKSVTVEKDGIFNVTKLNSTWDNPATEDDEAKLPGAKKDQLLIKGATYTLNGGKLYAEDSEWHGHVKVGTLNGTTSGLSLGNGDYSFTTMTVGTDSTFTVTDGADVSLDSLLVYQQDQGTKAGSVTISNSASLTVDDIKFEDANGSLTLDGGTLNTTAANLFDSEGNFKVRNFNLASGTLGIDGAFDISKAEQFNGVNVTVVADEIVAMVDGKAVEITTIKNEDLSTNVDGQKAVSGIVYGGATLQATEAHEVDTSAIHINTGIAGVQKIEILNETTTHIDLDSNFQLIGDGSQLVVGSDEDSQFRIEGQTLTLGTTADQSKGGTYLGRIMGAGTVEVVGGDFVLNDADVSNFNVRDAASVDMKYLKTTNGQVAGSLMTETLAADSEVTVSGNFGVQTIEAGATVQTEVNEAGDFFIAEAAVDQDGKRIAQIQGTLNAGSDSYLTTNLSAEAERRLDAALASLGDNFNEETDAVAYVDHTIDVGDNGVLNFGNVSNKDAKNAVKLASNSVVVLDAGKFVNTGDTVFGADVTLGSDADGNHARVVLDNLLSKGTIQFGESVNEGTGFYSDTNLFLGVSNVADGKLTIDFNREAVQGSNELADALDQVLAQGGNRENQEVINAIGQYDGFLNEAGTALNERGEQAAKEYLATPVTAGTYNMAYDSAELISNALIQHNLNSKQGLGVWADVFYGSNETDTLYGNSGYSSDIYGGMIGVDYGFGEGARVGAALSIGSGDGDSEGSVSKYSTDSDFWGLSVYTGKDVGGLTFTADMSYLWLDNDISGSVAGASASESLDSTVFTLGARADWKAYEGDVMQVVPHVGVRWAQIDVDDYRGLSMDKMNVFEMPIGVTVKGNIATASGWTVTPAIDFTAAPQIGDTEVETIVGDVDVIDNVYNASIGVSAGNDAMRFGLSYKYGFGNDGRSNNTFNLKASYLF